MNVNYMAMTKFSETITKKKEDANKTLLKICERMHRQQGIILTIERLSRELKIE